MAPKPPAALVRKPAKKNKEKVQAPGKVLKSTNKLNAVVTKAAAKKVALEIKDKKKGNTAGSENKIKLGKNNAIVKGKVGKNSPGKNKNIGKKNFDKNKPQPKNFNKSKPGKTNVDKSKQGKKNIDEIQSGKKELPSNKVKTLVVHGKEVTVGYFEGYALKKEDVDRLDALKKDLVSKGLPEEEIRQTLKLQRRRAENRFTREKKKICFKCHESGHLISDCPQLQDGSDATKLNTKACFKCGSLEHTRSDCKVKGGNDFKFAYCFVCKEKGHISKQCPKSSKKSKRRAR